MQIDPDLPETGRLAWLARRLNRIYAVLRSLQPVNSPDIETTRTMLGTVKRPTDGKTSGAGDDSGDARWA
jgi:hypothetical protein